MTVNLKSLKSNLLSTSSNHHTVQLSQPTLSVSLGFSSSLYLQIQYNQKPSKTHTIPWNHFPMDLEGFGGSNYGFRVKSSLNP